MVVYKLLNCVAAGLLSGSLIADHPTDDGEPSPKESGLFPMNNAPGLDVVVDGKLA